MQNWLILDNSTDGGIPVNLDFCVSIMSGRDIPGASADQKKTVFIYQGVQTQNQVGLKLIPIYKACQFTSENLAIAAYNRLINTIAGAHLIVADLRVVTSVITALSANTAVFNAGTVITVTGTNFTNGGKITINAVDQTTTYIDSTQLSFIAVAAGPSGPFDVEYTDTLGNAATFASFTFS